MYLAKKKLHDLKIEFENNKIKELEYIQNIVIIQSHIRMKLLRKAYLERLDFLNYQLKPTLTIQSTWRMSKVRKAYRDRLEYLQSKEHVIVKVH